MWEELGKAFVDMAYAGVGAAVIAAEQVGKLGKTLVERGEEALDQAGQRGEEFHQKVQEDLQRRREEALDDKIAALNRAQREEMRRRLDELDEIERQAEAMAAQEEAEETAEITEIHGGPKDDDSNLWDD